VGFTARAQNLVPNPSFETYDTCPYSGSQIYLASPWQGVTTNSTDYLNSCSPVYNVPNGGGFQYARTGVAHIGLWAINSYGGDYREYARVQLSSPLVTDSCYLVEFYCSNSNLSGYGVNKMGALLSTSPVNNVGPGAWGLVLQYIPQIESTIFLDDTLGWTRVFGHYTALGGEQYLTIGNFQTDAATDTIHLTGNTYDGCYMLVDDIRVEKILGCDTSGMWEYEEDLSFNVFPNPANEILTVEFKKRFSGNLKLLDASGRCLKNIQLNNSSAHQLSVSDISNGFYFLSLENENSVSIKTISVAH
jgi:hypothetical protein